jgi:hypothetical protein
LAQPLQNICCCACAHSKSGKTAGNLMRMRTKKFGFVFHLIDMVKKTNKKLTRGGKAYVDNFASPYKNSHSLYKKMKNGGKHFASKKNVLETK